ncbi:MAG: pantoate--beta-alanine ligase [Pseudomonadota bacterium]|jgi:pantoate--beta-alanine ligase
MRILETVASVRDALSGQPRAVFVPTMGGLHEGHLALVRRARALGGPVVVSVFVNRLQFGAGDDFVRYPRDVQQDCALLAREGCDYVFAPSEAELYPTPQVYRVVPPAPLAGVLEGAFRPGFFEGVCTVVLKLLAIVGPRYALFGKKDYQQLLVVQSMVRQFALPVEIMAVETVRDVHGLALSSRNAYLSPAQRAEAVLLHQVLLAATERVAAGTPIAHIEADAVNALLAAQWAPDYVGVRSRDLSDYVPGQPGVVLGAASLGQTRLIDNIEF